MDTRPESDLLLLLRSSVERLSGLEGDKSLALKSMDAMIRLQLRAANTVSANQSL